MSVKQVLDNYTYGLGLMYEFSTDPETMGKAVDAFLEVSRLKGEIVKEGGKYGNV